MECFLTSIPKALIAVPKLHSFVNDGQTNKTQRIRGGFLSTFNRLRGRKNLLSIVTQNMVVGSVKLHHSGAS